MVIGGILLASSLFPIPEVKDRLVLEQLLKKYYFSLLFSFSYSGDSKNCSSPDAVNKVRQHIVDHMDLWLSECRGGIRSSM